MFLIVRTRFVLIEENLKKPSVIFSEAVTVLYPCPVEMGINTKTGENIH